MVPHAPRGDVIAATMAARQAEAEQIFTFGGGYIRDAAKAMALCLTNDIHTLEQMDVLRSVVAPDSKVTAPSVKALTVQQITIPTRSPALSSVRSRA